MHVKFVNHEVRAPDMKQKVLLLCRYTAADAVILVKLGLLHDFSYGDSYHLGQYHCHELSCGCKRDQRATFEGQGRWNGKSLLIIHFYALPHIRYNTLCGLGKSFGVAQGSRIEDHALDIVQPPVVIHCELLQGVFSHGACKNAPFNIGLN